MVEAYIFFYDQVKQFFLGSPSELPIASEVPLASRLEECFQALRGALQVVVIDLDQDDDAQVIFETLNARGEPLLPADLLRNFIFLRAARAGESQEKLYMEYWCRFDDQFWRTEIKQGRLSRPRSDLFLQHFLASRQTIDIPIKHLFVEYKHWISKSRPFESVRHELETLARQGDDFRRIVEPQAGDVMFPLVSFLEAFDVRTVYPLLLHLLDAHLPEEEWQVVAATLESYLLRRAVCGLTTKNYNRVFLSLTRVLRSEGTSHERIRAHLSGLSGESVEWPNDALFRTAWMAGHAYQTMQNPKIVHIFKCLNTTYLSPKNESVVGGHLTVEHIMPQAWRDHWPLADGTQGLNAAELWAASPDDQRALATKRRNAALQTLGNLTIITQPLNASASNSSWEEKRTALLNASLLPINQQLHAFPLWDEEMIEERGTELFGRATGLWPGPIRSGG